MKQILKAWSFLFLGIISLLFGVYLLVAEAAWGIRNPKANDMTEITHFKSMMMFKRLPQFQE